MSERSCTGDMDEPTDTEDAVIASASSSPEDSMFDSAMGFIEDIIIEKDFQQGIENFMEKYYMEFDDSEENKLNYTTIFNEYVNLMETLLEQQLKEKIPGFCMTAFISVVTQRRDEVPEDIFDMLLSFTDFVAFKKDILDYRAEKEGHNLGLNQCLMVTPVPPGSNHDSVDSE